MEQKFLKVESVCGKNYLINVSKIIKIADCSSYCCIETEPAESHYDKLNVKNSYEEIAKTLEEYII